MEHENRFPSLGAGNDKCRLEHATEDFLPKSDWRIMCVKSSINGMISLASCITPSLFPFLFLLAKPETFLKGVLQEGR